MQEGISKRIIKVLILTIPDILTCRREPKMNNWLVMNISIDFKSIREYMMSIVLVTPPMRAKSKEKLTEDFVKNIASFASTVSVVMSKPACLLNCQPK